MQGSCFGAKWRQLTQQKEDRSRTVGCCREQTLSQSFPSCYQTRNSSDWLKGEGDSPLHKNLTLCLPSFFFTHCVKFLFFFTPFTFLTAFFVCRLWESPP